MLQAIFLVRRARRWAALATVPILALVVYGVVQADYYDTSWGEFRPSWWLGHFNMDVGITYYDNTPASVRLYSEDMWIHNTYNDSWYIGCERATVWDGYGVQRYVEQHNDIIPPLSIKYEYFSLGNRYYDKAGNWVSATGMVSYYGNCWAEVGWVVDFLADGQILSWQSQ